MSWKLCANIGFVLLGLTNQLVKSENCKKISTFWPIFYNFFTNRFERKFRIEKKSENFYTIPYYVMCWLNVNDWSFCLIACSIPSWNLYFDILKCLECVVKWLLGQKVFQTWFDPVFNSQKEFSNRVIKDSHIK